MANQKEIMDLVARIDDLDERTERLESLEYSTASFPASGDITCLEHAELTVDGTGHDFASIDQNYRHLMLSWKAARPDGEAGTFSQEWYINSAVQVPGDYSNFTTRRFFGGALVEAQNIPWTGSRWTLASAAGEDIPPAPNPARDMWSNGWALIEDYTDTNKRKVVHFTEFSYNGADTDPRAANTGMFFNYGGGFYRPTTAITRWVISAIAPQLYLAGSQWTLYGVCRKP